MAWRKYLRNLSRVRYKGKPFFNIKIKLIRFNDKILFMIINNILLLNLLVAILSSTYALLDDKKMVLYINEILKLRNTLEYDRNCSSLVSSFPPWNVISIILMPVIMLFKEPVLINSFVFHINYLPLFVLVSSAYLCTNAILIPVAYIKGIYVTLQQIWTTNQETNIWIRILKFLFFLFFFWPSCSRAECNRRYAGVHHSLLPIQDALQKAV